MKKMLSYGRSLSKDRPYAKKTVRSPTHWYLHKANCVPNYHIWLIILNIKQLTNLDLENWTTITLFCEKYYRTNMKSFSQINSEKPTSSLFDQGLFVQIYRCVLYFEKLTKTQSDLMEFL